MASSDIQRKLTAILCADVVGYSRLMGENEKATLRTLTEYRQVFSDYIEKFRGRIVDAKGDAILAEFASVVDAVESAAEIQRELAERNADLVEERKMLFRIGVNLGDVLVKEDVIYGDGVNIAARLESLAEPGGICVARSVYDQVVRKLRLHFEYMGEQQVKNIADPIHTYRVLSQPGGAAHRVLRWKRMAQLARRHAALAALAVVLTAVGAWLALEYSPQLADQDTADESGVLPQREKPSIAVLALDNMSGDPEQEYFSDGISEDIITDLSKISALFVVARNSSFTFKGKSATVKEIADKLGVRYVLEGSVRKSGERIRITTQLIDTHSGDHLWAERYDRQLTDVFELQDEITEKIVSNLNIQLTLGESERFRFNTTEDIAAWELYRKGAKLYRTRLGGKVLQAKKLYEQALVIDPDFEAALVGLGFTYQYFELWDFGWTDDSGTDRLGKALELAERALKLDENYSDAYSLLAFIHLLENQHGQALTAAKTAAAMKPGDAETQYTLSLMLHKVGKHREALNAINMALQLDPLNPGVYAMNQGIYYYYLGQPEKAIAVLRNVDDRNPLWGGARLPIIASYVAMGQVDQAKSEADYFTLQYGGNVGGLLSLYFYNFKNPADRQRIENDLIKAGLKVK